jgi:GntR family transcriptional repressor for pyruvate dehydrogenase complex
VDPDSRVNTPSIENAPISRVPKQDLQWEITGRLAQLIASSEPGDRLPTERELCELVGVGRSTLREAIRSLCFVGAVQTRQGSGTFVTPAENQAIEKLFGLALMLQRASVREIIESRRALEVEAVRLACERHLPEDRRQLEATMQEMAEAVNDPARASIYDLQYHSQLARASHNRVLVSLIDGMRTILQIWMAKAVNKPMVVEEIVREHNSVLDAVFTGDAERAVFRMQSHLTNAAERLLSVVGRDHSSAEYITLLMGPKS